MSRLKQLLFLQHSLWYESWDEYNDCAVWVHAKSNETQYDKPVVPSPPPIPRSLLDPLTGKKLSEKQIQENEADSDSKFLSDSRFNSHESNDGEGNQAESQRLEVNEAPKCAMSEVEFARMRMIERQRDHIRHKYKV